jgi:hypothetical protein
MTKPATKPPVEEVGKAVVSVQERIAQRLADVNKSTPTAGTKRISVKGSKFKLPNGTKSDGPLNCIIVDYTNNNAWYESDYEEGTVTPPDCFAVGKIISDMAPHASVEKPVSKTCADCPKNEFGSRGRGKACDNSVLIALLPEGFDDEAEVLTLKVAPKGLKDWGQYVRTLQAQAIDPIQVVTSISFVEGVSFPQLKFRSLGGNDNLENVGQHMPAADALLTG